MENSKKKKEENKGTQGKWQKINKEKNRKMQSISVSKEWEGASRKK